MLGIAIVTRKKLAQCLGEKKHAAETIEAAQRFVDQIAKGNMDAQLPEGLQKENLGASLLAMQASLQKFAREEYERNWITKGLANFSELLRDVTDLGDFCSRVISTMIKYLEYQQGSIYIADEKDGEILLRVKGSYAYDSPAHLEQTFQVGEDLVGACFQEKQAMLLENVPENYIQISSGLGKSSPRHVFFCPLVINEQVYGVIELASFKPLQAYQRTFIEKISENIAAAISTVKLHESTQKLLAGAKEQTQIMQEREETLRQNLIEMTEAQEKLKKQNDDFLAREEEFKAKLEDLSNKEKYLQELQSNLEKNSH